MKFVIITGVSGSGKSQALKYMEDMGFFCVDNLPPMLLGNLADACMHSRDKLEKVAVVMDIRGGEFFNGIFEALTELERKEYGYKVLFLDATDDELIRRYKETRHTHPLEAHGTLAEGIRKEKKILLPMRERADLVIDSSHLPLNKLREELQRFFADGGEERKMHLKISSFGYKRGLPTDADMVFDVRFLPNPYYREELRSHSGMESCIEEYLLSYEETKNTIDMLTRMIRYVLPLYVQETKDNLSVAIGCTGGMHRSVLIARLLGKELSDEFDTVVTHRDLEAEEARLSTRK